MAVISEGDLLWAPPEALRSGCRMAAYMRWLAQHRQLRFDSYAALWQWSVAHIEDFWQTIWEFFEVRAAQPYQQVLSTHSMPGAQWFSGAQLNYAEHIFRSSTPARPALLFQAEGQPLREISWAELERQVGALAAALSALGVRRGDRVAAYVPNIPEAVVALLACASLGAVWSSCSPDMGSGSVIDRLRQIAPKVLFAVDGYRYGGKAFDRRAVVDELRAAMPSLEQTVLIGYLQPDAPPPAGALAWPELLAQPAPLRFEPLPFEQPLWVLYSSGTTGLPKPIVQGHGGILLEQLKALGLHLDLGPNDRFFWFSTTGWMMWNFLVGGLLMGCPIVLYDGSPGWPDLGALWALAERAGVSFFGASAAYIGACMKGGLAPGRDYDLRRIKALGSTGSPLTVEGFGWVYERVKPDLCLASISGGTDVCTAFVGSCPLLPVYAGEIQCRWLGCAVDALDEQGRSLRGQLGELVLREPMPSMPRVFWSDESGQRYRESYFEVFPGIWRHGDWCTISERGGVTIYGRSDATINRMGVRMGTSELYRAVEGIPEVLDSLVVDLETPGQPAYMPLFVVLRPGAALDEGLKQRIRQAIRSMLSPRHVPDAIFAIPDIPRTLSGKKMELPVKKILLGTPPERAANPDSMSNPQLLGYFAQLAAELQRGRGAAP